MSSILFVTTCSGQSAATEWQALLDAKKPEEARKLCDGLTLSASQNDKVEGYKCLANVELAGQSVLNIQANDSGGAAILPAYNLDAVNKALTHLNNALQLAPQDLSIHQGRLHLLEVSDRFEEMANALDESCQIYKGKDGARAWIAYTAELFQNGQFQAALQLLKVLEKHFPDNHEVIGNLGAVNARLGNLDEAERYLRSAVAAAPADAYDNWDLGHTLEMAGKISAADASYQKALALPGWSQQELRESRCLYAEFVEKKLKQKTRACKLERASCPADERTACAR